MNAPNRIFRSSGTEMVLTRRLGTWRAEIIQYPFVDLNKTKVVEKKTYDCFAWFDGIMILISFDCHFVVSSSLRCAIIPEHYLWARLNMLNSVNTHANKWIWKETDENKWIKFNVIGKLSECWMASKTNGLAKHTWNKWDYSFCFLSFCLSWAFVFPLSLSSGEWFYFDLTRHQQNIEIVNILNGDHYSPVEMVIKDRNYLKWISIIR